MRERLKKETTSEVIHSFPTTEVILSIVFCFLFSLSFSLFLYENICHSLLLSVSLSLFIIRWISSVFQRNAQETNIRPIRKPSFSSFKTGFHNTKYHQAADLFISWLFKSKLSLVISTLILSVRVFNVILNTWYPGRGILSLWALFSYAKKIRWLKSF